MTRAGLFSFTGTIAVAPPSAQMRGPPYPDGESTGAGPSSGYRAARGGNVTVTRERMPNRPGSAQPGAAGNRGHRLGDRDQHAGRELLEPVAGEVAQRHDAGRVPVPVDER